MARPRKFLVRRSKDNLSIVFTHRARRVGTHPLGVLRAVTEHTGFISVLNIEETEIRETDFYEIDGI